MVVALLAAVMPLGAQPTTAPLADPWAAFLGCWSTSSNGVVGPMVCIVPSDSAQRVEFMTVDGDSVSVRTVVDASGKPRAQVRGACVGWEEAQWSTDQHRLYIHADYRCRNGDNQRADAIVAMTHADAFSQVEVTLADSAKRARVVNFIVQLDTTMYPVEVKRRLGSYRQPVRTDAELELINAVSPSDVMDAATNLDPAVVQAWLADRGESSPLSTIELRSYRIASLAAISRQPLIVPRAFSRAFSAAGYWNVPSALQYHATYRSESMLTNILITPAMVNFGGSATGFPDTSRGVAFRWP